MSFLEKEDYVEQRCLLCDEPTDIRPVPQQRIIEKMNDHMSRRDYAGAERHLLYWLEEARLGHDRRGELMIRNELVGHYRKTANQEQAYLHAEEALHLIEALGFEGTISAGTTYTNIATACNAFGDNEKALELFEKARPVYESSEVTRPDLLGGLYNNMALTLVAMRRFDEAKALYQKALETMKRVPNGGLEQAITYLNLADALVAEKGAEEAELEVFDLLDTALALLETPSIPRDGYYAFVCEKCAPTFEYYGYFLASASLKEQAEKIYAGN